MKANEMFEVVRRAYQAKYNNLDKWMEDVVLKKFIEVYPETSVGIPLSELPTTEDVLYHYLLKNGYHAIIRHADDTEAVYTIIIPPQGE